MEALESMSLSKFYHRNSVPALSDVTLRVNSGEIFTLLGRNGAGKTTFLRIAATQLSHTRGEMNVLGFHLLEEAREIRRRITTVPQEGSTIGPLTPWDHVFLTLVARGARRADARARTTKTLERLELSDYRNTPADMLSGGLRQRIRVAMAVAADADLLFLDEPTLGLDAVSRRRIWSVLKDLCNEGKTIVLTTHYMDEAEMLSNHVALIHQGELKTQGTPTELLDSTVEKVRVDVQQGSFSYEELQPYGRVVKVAERWRVLTDDERASELTREAMRRKVMVQMGPVSLEDLFVDIVGGLDS